MTLDEVVSHFVKPRKSGGQFLATCPCHDDKKASLAIKEENGRILVHCHVGCDYESVIAAVGLKKADLFLEALPSNGRNGHVKVAARSNEIIYSFKRANGSEIFQKVRKPNKEFVQRVAAGGGYSFDLGILGDEAKTLYNLPSVIAAIKSGETVYICEGEKACDALMARGYPATCQPSGADKVGSKWLSMHTEALKGANVSLIADRDEVGEDYASAVAVALSDSALSIQVVQSKTTRPHDDAHDHLAAGYEVKDFVERTDLMPVQYRFNLTDTGNAERFIANYGADVRWCNLWGRWLVWDGSRFKVDEKGGSDVNEMAKKTVRALGRAAFDIEDKGERNKLVKFALASEGGRELSRTIKQVQLSPIVAIAPSELDDHPYKINVRNGTLDLRTFKLHPHNRADLITKVCDLEYHPYESGMCPTWNRFLHEAMGGDQTLVHFLVKAIGYTLVADRRERCFFFCHGSGRNGKSTMLETMRKMMGSYATVAPIETFTASDQHPGIPNDIAKLVGARLVISTETEQNKRLAESRLKQFTGKDMVSARFLRAEFFDFMPIFALWIAGNHEPRISGTDPAIWDRVVKIPFLERFDGDREDKDLQTKLDMELSGIFSWAVEGCRRWQNEGLGRPQVIRDATEEYRSSQDILGLYISECLVVNDAASTSGKAIYDRYMKWCSAQQIKHRDNISFGKEFAGRFKPRSIIHGTKHYALDFSEE